MNDATTTTPPVPIAIRRLMEEARRRFESFQVRYGKTLKEGWVGMGMPSTYAPATRAGLMRPLHDRETPRILHWYLLTAEGVALYRALFPGSEDGTRRIYRGGEEVPEYDVTRKIAA